MLKRLFKSGSFWFTILAAAMLLAGVCFTIRSWDWLHPQASTTVSNSETLRNVGLLIGGGIAFVFALWRSWLAERQADTAQRQADMAQQQANAAQRQAEVAQQSLLNDRYRSGEDTIRSDVLSSRLSGIDALRRLAQEYPAQMHVRIIGLLCTFARLQTTLEYQSEQMSVLPEDIRAVVDIIRTRSATFIAFEEQDDFVLDLRDADLRNADLTRANLSRAELTKANLSNANLTRVNLSDAEVNEAVLPGARLWRADLSRASLQRANLVDARLQRANLSGTRLSMADLSGARLDEADLSGARLWNANLSGARLDEADLSDTRLWRVNLSGTSLLGADLSGAELVNPSPRIRSPRPARNLTQAQLDEARADPDNPPKLDGVVDAVTEKALVWRR